MLFKLFAFCVLATLISFKANAVVTFDNLTGFDNTKNEGGVWTGYSAFFNTYSVAAEQFTAITTGSISKIELLAWSNTGTLNSFNVGIYADNAGTIGSWVENLAVSNTNQPFFSYTLATGNYNSGVELTGGQSYWLVLGPNNSTVEDWYMSVGPQSQNNNWFESSQTGNLFTLNGDQGHHYYTNTAFAGYNFAPGMIVELVPEPEQFALLIVGLPLISLFARKKQNS